MNKPSSVLLWVALCLAIVTGFPAIARSDTFDVNATNDNSSSMSGSLRDAVTRASASSAPRNVNFNLNTNANVALDSTLPVAATQTWQTNQNVGVSGSDIRLESGTQLELRPNSNASFMIDSAITSNGNDAGIRVSRSGNTNGTFINQTTPGFVVLNSNSSYSGDTVIAEEGRLLVTQNGQLPANTNVRVLGPQLALNQNTNNDLFDRLPIILFDSGAHAIGSLDGRTGILAFGAIFGNSNGSSPSILTVGANGANSNYSGFVETDEFAQLVKAGSGTFVFGSGGAGFIANTNVVGGTFQLDGQLATRMNIDSGATLSGNGTLGFPTIFATGEASPQDLEVPISLTVQSGGTVSPGVGTTVGRLTVQGPVTFNAGSTYRVKTTATTADSLVVEERTTLNGGTVRVVPNADLYSADPNNPNRYTIVTSQARTGTFAGVTSSPLFNARLEYSATPDLGPFALAVDKVDLLLYRLPFASFGEIENCRNAGDAIDRFLATRPTLSTEANTQLSALFALESASAVSDALCRISGGVHGQLLGAFTQSPLGLESTREYVQETAGSSTTNQASGAGKLNLAAAGSMNAAMDVPRATDSAHAAGKWQAQARGHQIRGDLDGDGTALGSQYRVRGATLFFDRKSGDGKNLFGVYAGSTDGDLQQKAVTEKIDVDGYRLGAYSHWNLGELYLMSVSQYTHNNYDSVRNIAFGGFSGIATASYGGHGYASYLEAGTWRRHGSFEIEPSVALQYNRENQRGFTEAGAGFFNLTLADASDSAFFGSIGARVRRPYTNAQGRRWLPEVRARYAHNFESSQAFVNAAFAGAPGVAFRIGSTDMGRDVWLFGARVRGETSASTALLINYDMQVAKNQMVHTGEAGLSLRF